MALLAMTAKGQLGWGKLFLILTVLPCCSGLQVSIPVPQYEVARGGEIAMSCYFIPANPDYKALFLNWETLSENNVQPVETVASYFLNLPVDITPGYEGRASLEVDLETHVSTLRLSKVTMQDNRHFQCSVSIAGDDQGVLAATTSLLVLVPPSVPICTIQGETEYWHNITLTCASKEGSPAPDYEWRSYSVENIAREFPPKATQNKGVLSLFNISRETSGYYICTSTNKIASASCNVTLAVTPGSMNAGSIPAIIGGVAAGLLVLGILIFCCCRKKDKEDKEYAKGIPLEEDRDVKDTLEEQYWDDKSNSETKQQKYEDNDVVPLNSYSVATAGHKFEDDQHSHVSGKESNDGKGSDIDSQHRRDDQHDHYRGSRDRLDYQPDRYRGRRDGLDDRRDRYGGSRDGLDDRRDRYGGSRDRLDDQRERFGGSRDRLDDRRDGYGGSRDRLDDRRDGYGGSRDRLDDRRDGYGGSRDRLDDRRDGYGGSRDRLDDRRYGGSRDRLDDRRYGGSRDRLDYIDNQYKNRYE